MSKTVDERVVEMRFDNKDFESNVKTSMSTLEKLKNSLKLSGATKGLEEVGKSAKQVDFSGISNGVETVSTKFSALQVMGVTALATITNAALSAGKNIASALTLTPVIDGFKEYETQMGAIQTILANTQSKGTTLNQVNAALDELNKYADKTIYNFTEMTKNIGTFTAAGVDLQTSVSSIKGIANLAAVSGSTSLQASTAMYQLSQAIATGRVALMDWNSVVNAGMGGEVFQNALKRTAENLGTDVDALIEKYGSFRDSLTKGEWITTEVLTETLAQISGAYTEADLISQGYTKSQAKEILELAQTAEDAATKVKTFTQLIDTLREALGSGWTKSWQILIGDFQEAKDLWTGVSEVLSEMIENSAEARNKVLSEGLSSGWDQFLELGVGNEENFTNVITDVAKKHGVAIDDMIKDQGSFEKTLKQGWVTTDILAESIAEAAKETKGLSKKQLESMGYTQEEARQLQELNEQVKNGSINLEEYANKMSMISGRENIIAGLSNLFNELLRVMAPIKEAFNEVFPPATGEQLYALTQRFKEFTEQFKVSDSAISRIKSTFKGLFSILSLIGKVIGAVLPPIITVVTAIADAMLSVTALIGDFFTAINEGAGTGDLLGGISTALSGAANTISGFITSIAEKVTNLEDLVSSIADVISKVASKIGQGLKAAFSWITDNVGISDALNALMLYFTAMGALDFSSLVKKIKGGLTSIFGGKDGEGGKGLIGLIFGDSFTNISDVVDKFTEVLDGIHGALQSFTTGIKTASLLAIATAIGILTASVAKLSELSPQNIAKSITAIGFMLGELVGAFTLLTAALAKFDGKGVMKAGVAMIFMAEAMKIMADALIKLQDLSVREIGSGLFAMAGGLGEMIAALKLLEKIKVSLKSAAAVVVLAKACQMLADAFKGFVGYSWEEIGKGLSSMGGALGELTAALAILSKAGGFGSLLGSVGVLIAVQSLGTLAEALKSFAGFSGDEIKKGLVSMGGALGEITVPLAVLSKIGGFGSILGGAGIFIVVQTLSDIAEAFKSFTSYSWDEIGRGLAAMGGALGEIGLVTGALGKLAGVSGIIGSASIFIAVQSLGDIAKAFESFTSYSWDEIGRGLAAMGGALAEIGLVTGGLGKLAGVSGILGGGTLLIAAQSLEPISQAFQSFTSYSWEEIGKGLVAMGGALLELGGISGATGYLTGIAGLVGAGTITLASQGLTELADAFGKFAEMDWDAIGRGLTAMGGAMAETALGSLLNTFSGFGAASIAEVAGPLGTLADSVKKWTGITVPEGFGDNLASIGKGVEAFNFSGWGADAISSMGGSLGTLAESVQKWAGVSVPEGLGDSLKSFAPGIEAFNFSGWGADAIAAVAEPLGTLAGSVNKWASVTVPENMEGNLTSLARGVQAFNFSWGDSLNSFVEPLAKMADSVNKWSTITVPENMEGNLTGLANGVKAFNFSFGWSMDSFVEPLSRLADAVAKWKDITVPSNMQTMLEGLAAGVKAFDWSFGWSLDSFIEPLNKLGDVLPKYSGLAIATDIGTSIKSLGEGIGSLAGKNPGDISSISKAITDLGNSVQIMSSYDFAGATSKLTSFANAINSINVSGDKFASLGQNIVNGFVNAINSGVPRVQASVTALANVAVSAFSSAVSSASQRSSSAGLAMISGLSNGMRSGVGALQSNISSILSSAISTITSKSSSFQTSGRLLVSKLTSGILSGKAAAASAVSSVVSSAASNIRGYYSSFYSSGSYVAQGFAAGIRSGSFAASVAARAMANAAKTAAQAALDEHSPSKEFYKIGDFAGQGFVNALGEYESISSKAGYEMADAARSGLTKAISKISSVINSDMDMNPTISPVLDLSNVKSGVGAIDGMLSSVVPVDVLSNVSSINRSMNSRIQNGGNSDVVDAIDKLRKNLSELSGPSYTVNGITYDDGTNISEAVKTLVRQSRIERRI